MFKINNKDTGTTSVDFHFQCLLEKTHIFNHFIWTYLQLPIILMDLSYEKISLILIGVLTHIAEHCAYYHLVLWLCYSSLSFLGKFLKLTTYYLWKLAKEWRSVRKPHNKRRVKNLPFFKIGRPGIELRLFTLLKTCFTSK